MKTAKHTQQLQHSISPAAADDYTLNYISVISSATADEDTLLKKALAPEVPMSL